MEARGDENSTVRIRGSERPRKLEEGDFIVVEGAELESVDSEGSDESD